MFQIGEFSKIAQVSARMLRHYDRLGLLTPERTDPFTGYRYYSATQLPRLNRIIALKELGLSLEQIGRLLNDNIATSEIRGMLVMQKAQLEQELGEKITRFRHIESRIAMIDIEGYLKDYDVVLKSIPSQRFLALRCHCARPEDAMALVEEISTTLPRTVGEKQIGPFVAIVYSDMFELDDIDVELGYTLHHDFQETITLADNRIMTLRELPAVETMATVTRVGDLSQGHDSYGAIGLWVEANGYRFAGPGRELFIQFPQPGKEDEAVTEIQFPVEKIDDEHPLLS